jgi:long-chain acyl-CoA synthetase
MFTGIAGRAAADPAGWALTDGTDSLNWADLNGAVNRAVHAVLGTDLGPDRRVAIMAPNSAQAAIAHLAVIYAGASAVPVNWQLRPSEAEHILRDSAARLVLASPQSGPVARRACLPGAVVIDSLAEFAATAPPGEPPASFPPRRALMYTSGTSGMPKAVEQALAMFAGGATIAEHVANIAASPAARLGPHLVAGPLHHTGPLNGLRCLAAGTPTAVLPRFDAAAALAAIEQYRIASSTMVPTHFARLLALPAEVRTRCDIGSLRRVAHTGAPCPADLKRAMIEWLGPVIVEAYGSTEVGSVTVIESADWLAHPGSVGRAVPPFEVTIRDETGRELPAGVEGLVCVRNSRDGGPRYVHDREKTAASFVADGYFVMGEIGLLDGDGYLYLTDRASDLVVSGGVNIYPAEAEAVLAAHPGVTDVAVIGVPEPDLGETLLALVVRGDPALTAEELVAWCRDRLTHFKCPRAVRFVPHLPRTAMGKLSKRDLRVRYGTRGTPRQTAPVTQAINNRSIN